MCHDVDAREIPKDWEFSRFRLRCNEPWCEDGATIGTEVFRLDSALVQKAYNLTKDVTLFDSRNAKKIRKKYRESSMARQKPIVTIGDNLAGSTFLFGKINSEWSEWWVKKWTNGKGTYYTTNMEDNGSLTALKRLSDAKIISYNRILVLRTASNFDQQVQGEDAIESLNNRWEDQIAIKNTYKVGSKVAHDIITNWNNWNVDHGH
jgi:purine nucleoside permease